MNWDQVFAVTNVIALGGWLALAALPRREVVMNAVLFAAIALLCLVYLVLFVALIGNLADPVRDTTAPLRPFEYTVDGLKTMFASQGAIVIGWTHYLAFDLFVGLWIAREADRRKVGRIVQIPFLFATFMAGPIGLLAWLILRKPLTHR